MLSGVIEEFGIHSTVQLPEVISATGTMVLTNGRQEYRLVFEQGVLRHAEAGPKQGDEAFFAILKSCAVGTFRLETGTNGGQRTIDKPVQMLLMQAARRKDEEELEQRAAAAAGSAVQESLKTMVADLGLAYAALIERETERHVMVAARTPEGLEDRMLGAASKAFLKTLDADRLLGADAAGQFAFGRTTTGWLLIGAANDVPFGMIPTLLKKGIKMIDGGQEA